MNKTLVIRLAVAITLALVAIVYLLFFHITPQHNVSAEDGWLFGIAQLTHAQKLSKQQQRPLFIYLTRRPCKDCTDFETRYLTLPSISKQIRPLVKIRIDVDPNHAETQHLLDLYQVIRLPAIIIKHHTEEQGLRLHVLMDLQQVWLPIPNYDRGNYTPLSETTLNLALSKTLSEAQRFADTHTEPLP